MPSPMPFPPAPGPIALIILTLLFYSLVNMYVEWRKGGGKWW
jgi:hypothetical protein